MADYYRHELRNIQYHLPNHEFTTMEKQLLIINMKYFAGHSKYLTQMLKVVDWNDAGMADYAIKVLKKST